MQWLVDLVIAAIGVPPCYVHRPEVFGYDWVKGDLTLDGSFYTLDASAIVPENATGILLKVEIRATAAEKWMFFRKNGFTNWFSTNNVNTQVANIYRDDEAIIGIDSDRKFQYALADNTFNVVNLTILGWFM